jgi:hypothetical protein
MRTQIRTCPKNHCTRPFKINIHKASASAHTVGGWIVCPHCGFMISADTDYIYMASALHPEEEAKFMKNKTAPYRDGE